MAKTLFRHRKRLSHATLPVALNMKNATASRTDWNCANAEDVYQFSGKEFSMLGWAVGFFVLSIIAAIFGFGGVATAFAGIAQLLFVVFVVLFVLSLLVSLFTGGAHGGPALTGTGRTLGLLTVVALIAVGVYVWVENDWSAERLGRSIDRGAVAARDDAGEAIDEVSQDTERFIERSREDLKENADEAAKDDK